MCAYARTHARTSDQTVGDVERRLLNGKADQFLDGCHSVLVVALPKLGGHVALEHCEPAVGRRGW